MKDMDWSLDVPDSMTALAPAYTPTGRTEGRERAWSEETESLEALYRLLIDKEQRLLTMLAEQERRFEAQAERDRKLAGLVAPSEQRQQARYARLNEFLRRVMERTEQAATDVLARGEAAAEQLRERARRDTEAWRREAGRGLKVLMATIALLTMLQTALLGLALWQSAKERGVSPPRVRDPSPTDPARGLASPASPP
jgi:hypothetical protein